MLLIADMDSTMIHQECIDELAAEAGVGNRVADITARAMNGELDFEAAIIERVWSSEGLAGRGYLKGPGTRGSRWRKAAQLWCAP